MKLASIIISTSELKLTNSCDSFNFVAEDSRLLECYAVSTGKVSDITKDHSAYGQVVREDVFECLTLLTNRHGVTTKRLQYS